MKTKPEIALLGVGTAISDARAAVRAAGELQVPMSFTTKQETRELRSAIWALNQAVEGIYEAMMAFLATEGAGDGRS